MPRQLSADTLRARIEQLEKQARLLERGAMKGLRATATIIAKHGLSLSDLRQAFAMSKGGRKRGSLAGRTVAVKYRDDQGNTWAGRGRPPLWLVAAEKAGKKRESFLVEPRKGKVAKSKIGKPRKAPGRGQRKVGGASAPNGSTASV